MPDTQIFPHPRGWGKSKKDMEIRDERNIQAVLRGMDDKRDNSELSVFSSHWLTSHDSLLLRSVSNTSTPLRLQDLLG